MAAETTEELTPTLIPFDSDSFIVGVDSHASRTLSNSKRHFVGKIMPIQRKHIKGIDGQLEIKGIGTIKWKITDDEGMAHTLTIPNIFYVPKLDTCILSPQHWAEEAGDDFPLQNGTQSITQARNEILIWNQRRYKRTIPHDPATNTPRFRAGIGTAKFRAFEAVFDQMHPHHICYRIEHRAGQEPIPNTEEQDEKFQEDNLIDHLTDETKKQAIIAEQRITDFDDPQMKLLHWHHRLGHCSFHLIRALSIFGILPKKLASIRIPKCATCQFGSMTKIPWRTKATANKIKVKQVLAPGDCVSVDQLQSSLPGFIGQLKGKLTKKRYMAATVFVDHYSRLSYTHLQQTLSSDDTLQAKQAFETYCSKHGVKVKHYHADNGHFADNAFLQDVKEKHQSISFCGVNAHFQNGIAEKKIRDLTELARKQILHAKARWNQAIHLALWPYALRNAMHIHNQLPNSQHGLSPIEIFTGASVSPNLKHHHTFGCPAFALDNSLQSGKSIPKWNPRARVGINLGHSPRHSPSVSLILNTNTGLVSPQFHISFDEHFDSTRNAQSTDSSFSQWQYQAGLRASSSQPNATNVMDFLSKIDNPEITTGQTRENIVNPLRTSQPDVEFHTPLEPIDEQQQPAESLHAPREPHRGSRGRSQQNNIAAEEPALPTSTSRYGRIRKLTPKMQEYQRQILSAHLAIFEDEDPTTELDHPLIFSATSNPDTMYFDEGMKQPDREQFLHAVVKEVNDHITRKHWKLIPRSQVPKGVKVLPSVWSLKRKREIKTRQVYKWKARLNVHGGRQEKEINYWETFAPVVTWITIRLLLILTIINKWKSRQVDFILAYPQANIETDMYMELPKGIEMAHGKGKTHVLQLIKNLYGQKQAGRVWNLHLKERLIKIGFIPSSYNECLFFRHNVMFVVYVDDGIFVSPSSENIDKAIQDLKNEGLDMDDQGDLKDYLGVNITTLQNGQIKLSQPHLIEQIIEESKLSIDSPTKVIPANSSKIFIPDYDGKEYNGKFNYRSIIGRLNFLEKSTRPDIAYSVHQCARFSANPKVSHGKAIEHIVNYLNGTKEDGIILKPDFEKSLEVYADADFAGNWHKPDAEFDANTAKSRT